MKPERGRSDATKMHVHCSMMGAYVDSRALRSTRRSRSVSCHVGSAILEVGAAEDGREQAVSKSER